jgi:uncharacterized repeat protein (TIGR03803 family)
MSNAGVRSNCFLGITAELALALVVTSGLFLADPVLAQAQTYSVIYNFTGGADGGSPYTGLTIDSRGNLYGTTATGGMGYGTVFELMRTGSGWISKPLYSFLGGEDGAEPLARVIFGPDGNLYGTTYEGGEGGCTYGYGGCGTVFRLQPPPAACKDAICPWRETVIYRPAENYGAYLSGEVTFDTAGNLYSTVGNGGQYEGGYVFELTPSNGYWTESTLYSFLQHPEDGAAPRAGVVFDQAGNLYGTTNNGGAFNAGTAFELSPNGSGWTETLRHAFDNSDGNGPMAPLVFDHQGNLYGTTFDLGPNGGGTIFELSPNGGGWTFSLPWAFSDQGSGGSLLVAPVSFDSDGNMYGTTFGTGCCGVGTIFKLSPGEGGWTETVLYNFLQGTDGYIPYSNVVFDASGNAYGTASSGGAHNAGVIWEVTPN